MAEEGVDPNHQKCILGNLAADEAALDVEIEMAFLRYEALYHNLKEKDTEIAAKKEKSKQLDELIEAKKNELDGIVKQREEIRKRTTSVRRNVENAQKLLAFYEEDRTRRQEQRESIAARYQVLIDRKKEKINSYPLVVERDKLKNELLAANVELGILNYRNAAKKKREEQMKEIKKQLLNNAIVKMAQSFVDVRKLEEDNSKLLQERKKIKSSSITALEEAEERDERNLDETTLIDWTNKLSGLDSQGIESSLSRNETQSTQNVPNVKTNEIDGVLKNFRAKLQVRMCSSSVLLPPALSIEKQIMNNSKSGEREKSEQLVTSNTNETPNKTENAAINCDKLPKVSDKENSNSNGSGEVLPRRGGSAKGSDTSNNASTAHETNMRLRNALIATQSRNKVSTGSGERKRILLQKTTQHGVKYLRTDDFVAPKRWPDKYYHPSSSNNTIDHQERGGNLHEPVVAQQSQFYNNGRPSSVRKVHGAARIQKMECVLPENAELYPTAQEVNNVVPSTYFHETAIERNEQVLPASMPVQGYVAYEEHDDQNEQIHADDEPNPNERMNSMKGAAEKRYANRYIAVGERRNAGEEYVGKEQEYIATNEYYNAQLQLSDENGAEDYSDPNEIDADNEYPGTRLKAASEPTMNRVDEALKKYSSNSSSKERSSYEGMFVGTGKPRSFDQEVFARAEGNVFAGGNLGNSKGPKSFSFF